MGEDKKPTLKETITELIIKYQDMCIYHENDSDVIKNVVIDLKKINEICQNRGRY